MTTQPPYDAQNALKSDAIKQLHQISQSDVADVADIFKTFKLEALINIHLKLPEYRDETTPLLVKITNHVNPYKDYLVNLVNTDTDGSLWENADHAPGNEYGDAGNFIADLKESGIDSDEIINNLYNAVDQHPFTSAYRGAEW